MPVAQLQPGAVSTGQPSPQEGLFWGWFAVSGRGAEPVLASWEVNTEQKGRMGLRLVESLFGAQKWTEQVEVDYFMSMLITSSRCFAPILHMWQLRLREVMYLAMHESLSWEVEELDVNLVSYL